MKFSPRLMMKVPGKGILNRKGLPWRQDGEVSRSPTALLARPGGEARRGIRATMLIRGSFLPRHSRERTYAKGAAEAPTSTAPGHRTRAWILALVTGSYATSPAGSCKDPPHTGYPVIGRY